MTPLKKSPPARGSQVPVRRSQVPVRASQGPVRASQGPVRASQGPVRASQGPVRASQGPVRTDALDRSVGYSLRRAQFSTYALFSACMDSFDIRPSQYAVLVLIRANPGLSQTSICTELGIQKTNFVALLDGLEKRGLTERRKAGGDRRSSALHLTADGEDFAAKMEAAHTVMEKKLAQRLGKKRTQELLAALQEFSNHRHR